MPYWNNTPLTCFQCSELSGKFLQDLCQSGWNPPKMHINSLFFSSLFSLFFAQAFMQTATFSPLSWTSTFDPFEEVRPHSFMAAEYFMFSRSLNFTCFVDGFSSLSYRSSFVCKKTRLKLATQLDSATWQLQSSSDTHHGLIRVWLLAAVVSFWQSGFSGVVRFPT